MKADPSTPSRRFAGVFEHVIYSPKGAVESALVRIADKQVQLIVDDHDGDTARALGGCVPEQPLAGRATPEAPSAKGPSTYPRLRLQSLDAPASRASGGRSPADAPPATTGVVVRLNYARHGEPNGVVLDNGDFVHTRPEAMATLRLAVGDTVVAHGETQPLFDARGRVVEAVEVNGQAIARKPPPHKTPDPKPR